jgi:FKBP-type peptidyl-prolyl cis-trans isomerase/CpeT/CpcT family (DUF1001)
MNNGMQRLMNTAVIAGIALASSALAAQDATDPAAAGPAMPPPPVAVDDGIEAVKSALIGSWKTTSTEYNADADETGGTMWMSVSPINIAGLDNTLYVERAWDASKQHPFGQTILQVYRFKGDLRLRSLEFRLGAARSNIFAGLWAVPEAMPPLNANELIATLDYVVERTTTGFDAQTPYPYPTATSGACQLLSEFSINGDIMTSLDKGIATDGSVAWSSNDGSGYAWERAEMDIRVTKGEDGFVMIEYAGWDSPEATAGDQAFLDHVGQTEKGVVFWSAAQNRTLAQLTLPLADTPIEGLTRTLKDIRRGTARRTVVPPALGYGEIQTGQIPPNSTLYFMIDCVDYEEGELPQEPDPDAVPGDPADPHAGHNHPPVEGGGGGG